jgi:hypothetical protein
MDAMDIVYSGEFHPVGGKQFREGRGYQNLRRGKVRHVGECIDNR